MQQPARRPLWPAIAASLAVSLGIACTPQPQYPECKNDTICAAQSQVCVAGFCRGCRDDSQCLANEQCVANGCVKTPEPAAPPACPPGGCAPSAECIGDGECGMGKACVDGKCLAQSSLTQIYSGASVACVAGPIYFSYDDTSLDQRARDAIAAAWTCVQGEGFRRIRLLGNTDERGTTEYNLALGSHRAEAVRKYLIGLGADGRKLHTVSFGKERPADDGQNEAAWEKNRRVELDLEK